MGFPKTFYCVCEGERCPWNVPGQQAFGRIVVEGGARYIEPDDRPRRIVGSSYWDTCVYHRVIVFEATFIRTLRDLACGGALVLDELPEALARVIGKRHGGRVPDPKDDEAAWRVSGELSRLERELGTVNGHLEDMAQLVRHLVFQSRALLDERREPHYWPSPSEALRFRIARAFVTRAAERRRGYWPRRQDAQLARGAHPGRRTA